MRKGPIEGFRCHATELGHYSAENWKSTGVLKLKIISVLFLRNITGSCEEDGQQGDRQMAARTVWGPVLTGTMPRGFHAWMSPSQGGQEEP